METRIYDRNATQRKALCVPQIAPTTDTVVYGSGGCSTSKDAQPNSKAATSFSFARADARPDPQLHEDLVHSDTTPRAIRFHRRLKRASRKKLVIFLNCLGKPHLGNLAMQGPHTANGRRWGFMPAAPLANIGTGSYWNWLCAASCQEDASRKNSREASWLANVGTDRK